MIVTDHESNLLVPQVVWEATLSGVVAVETSRNITLAQRSDGLYVVASGRVASPGPRCSPPPYGRFATGDQSAIVQGKGGMSLVEVDEPSGALSVVAVPTPRDLVFGLEQCPVRSGSLFWAVGLDVNDDATLSCWIRGAGEWTNVACVESSGPPSVTAVRGSDQVIMGTGEPNAYSYVLCDRAGVIRSLKLPLEQVVFGAYSKGERLGLLTVDDRGVMRAWQNEACVRTINPWYEAGGRLLVAPVLVAPGVVASRESPDVVLLCSYLGLPGGAVALYRWRLGDVRQLAGSGDGIVVACCGKRLVAARVFSEMSDPAKWGSPDVVVGEE
jgi:hypothetical protein